MTYEEYRSKINEFIVHSHLMGAPNEFRAITYYAITAFNSSEKNLEAIGKKYEVCKDKDREFLCKYRNFPKEEEKYLPIEETQKKHLLSLLNDASSYMYGCPNMDMGAFVTLVFESVEENIEKDIETAWYYFTQYYFLLKKGECICHLVV